MSFMLSYPLFDGGIELCENEILQIIIENKKAFCNFINDVIIQIGGNETNFLLSENFDEINLNRQGEIMIDYFGINENEKNILSKIYSEISDVGEESEFVVRKNEINSLMLSLIENISELFEIGIEYSDIPDFKQLLKAFNVRVDSSCNDSLCEKILSYIKLKSSLMKTRVFVFVNLKCFVSDDELKELYKYILYNKLIVIDVESNELSRLENERTVIIDNDLCQIC